MNPSSLLLWLSRGATPRYKALRQLDSERAGYKAKIRPHLAVEGRTTGAQATLCRGLVFLTEPSQQRFTPLAGAGLGYRARFFCLEPGLVSWPCGLAQNPRPGPPGATTFPRIWNRSINARKNRVKGKNAKYRCYFRTASICSGPLSPSFLSTPSLSFSFRRNPQHTERKNILPCARRVSHAPIRR